LIDWNLHNQSIDKEERAGLISSGEDCAQEQGNAVQVNAGAKAQRFK
jgi:hypothetical protein